jgi:GxxExxY protein
MINTDKNYIFPEVTETVIGCAYKVFNQLGSGFLEKVYENALKFEMEKEGLKVSQQHPVNVYYSGQLIGEYFADLMVDDKVIIELKAVSELNKVHEVQLVNYLKGTGFKVGLLINFGEKMKIVRRVC